MSSFSRVSREELLRQAMAVFVAWREAGDNEPPGDVLARHAELREFLEPLLSPQLDSGPASSSSPVLATLLGDFRLEREIGRGGMGVVHEAVQISLGRRVALKVLPPLQSTTALARFVAEAELAGRLDHPGIVRVVARGDADGVHWLAMELVEGSSFERLLEQVRMVGLDHLTGDGLKGVLVAVLGPACAVDPSCGWISLVVALTAQVADALHHGHGAGVVHRDVKPGNILIRRSGEAVLTDFGLARDLTTPSLTRTGAAVGTPFYMSPEQVNGDRALVDHRADVFSLGATLYEALTLLRPFCGDSSAAVMQRILTRDPPEPDRVNPRVARDLAAIVMRALEKEPGRRYESAAAFAADLRAYQQSRPIAARRSTALQRGLRWARRERPKAALILGLILAVPIITGLLGYLLAAAPAIREGSAKLKHDRIEQLLAQGMTCAIEGVGDGGPSLHEALALDPDSGIGLIGLAFCFRDQGREAELAALLDASAAKASLAGVVHRLRARPPAVGGAVELEPPRGMDELLVDAVTTGRLAERQRPELFAPAMAMFKRLIERSPGARLVYHSQWAHLAGHLRDRDEIERATQALATLWPDSGFARFWIGFAWLHSDPARAALALRHARLLLPNDRRLLMDLALAETEAGDPAAAIPVYRDVLERRPEDRGAWFSLGLTALAAGQPAEAAAAFRRLLEIEPRHHLAHYNLGVAVSQLGDRAEALRQYRVAVELAPEHPESRVNLGLALHEIGEIDAALVQLREAVRVAPAFEPAHTNLLATLLELGRRKDAELERQRWAARPGPAEVRSTTPR